MSKSLARNVAVRGAAEKILYRYCGVGDTGLVNNTRSVLMLQNPLGPTALRPCLELRSSLRDSLSVVSTEEGTSDGVSRPKNEGESRCGDVKSVTYLLLYAISWGGVATGGENAME